MTTYSYHMLTSVDPGETHDRQMFYSVATVIPVRHWGCPNLAFNYQYILPLVTTAFIITQNIHCKKYSAATTRWRDRNQQKGN